jgi:hypothetical protein
MCIREQTYSQEWEHDGNETVIRNDVNALFNVKSETAVLCSYCLAIC